MAAALAMVAIIGLMVSLSVMHPPAVGMALRFAFRAGGSGEGSMLLFALAVGLVVGLVFLQCGSAYLLGRLGPTTPTPVAVQPLSPTSPATDA